MTGRLASESSVETVAVVFTDLVDSTATAMRVAPADADEFRRRHFGLLRDAVERFGGREVKNLGDGLMVVFSTCSAAVGCAVEMQSSVQRASSGPLFAGLRIGVAVGEATQEDDDFFGDPVIEAARLCAAAGAGNVLATELVASMAGRRSGHGFRSVGQLNLKGLVAPVAAFEVMYAPPQSAPEQVPLPASLARLVAGTLVGRDDELASLDRMCSAVLTGGATSFAFVSGEPGIGKTSLVGRVAVQMHRRGACVLSGRCDEHATLTYQPFIESFDHYVRHVSDEDLHGLITQCGPEVAAFLPTLSRRASVPSSVVSADPEASRYLLYSSITALIGAIARRRPVVLILEDLHWADAASIDLLRYLGDHIDAERIMVLITYRDSVVHREHPLSSAIGDLHRRGGVMQLRLEGLDGPAVTSLVESAAGHPLDADGVALAGALADETQGNPFFIREVLRHLVDVGSLVNDDGRWRPRSSTDAIVVPDSVRQVIDSRIDHLGQDCRRALELGAVIGREFELALMKLVLDTDELSLLELLEHPVQAGILREVAGDRYRFNHALIQHALYDGLAGGRRTRLHRRVAEAYEADPAQRPGSRTAELARHWAASDDPANMRRAVRYAREAGEASMAQLAPRDACTYFAEALATLERIPTSDRGERLDLAIQLGTAQRELGDPAFKATLIAAALDALDLDDTPRLVRSVLAADRGTYTTIGRVDDDRVNTVRAALQRLGDSHATDGARLLAILANELTWVTPIDERIELATRAVTLARASRDPETVVRVASLVCFAIQVPETLDLRLDFSADALAQARALGDPLLLHWAAATRSITAVHACLADELDEDFELIEATAARLTTPTVSWQAKLRAASRALILGQPERAEALAVEARDFGVTHGHPSTGFIAHYLGTLAATLGRRDEAAGHDASALASAERMGATWATAITCLEWGRLRLAHPATADARQTTGLLQRAAALAHNNGYATISRRVAEVLV